MPNPSFPSAPCQSLARWRMAGLLLAGACLCAPAWSMDLGELMQAMGKHKERHGRFVETRRMALLEKPLRATGEVRYVAPSLFEKKTLEPSPELMRVDGNKLYIERGDKKYHLRLSSQPEAAAFVDAVVGLLTGDASVLQRSYQYELGGSIKKWTLTLVPRDKKMQAVISKVIATGDQEQVRSIEYLQADGDKSTMQIEPLAVR